MKKKSTLIQDLDVNKVKKICINCCGLIGDTLLRTPFIEKAAELFRNSRIDVITDIRKEILLSNHPNVDRVISYNRKKKPRLRYVKNFLNIIFSLRKEKYDIMFNLYGGGTSIALTKYSKSKSSIGFHYNKSTENIYTFSLKWPAYEMAGLHHWGQTFGLLLKPFNVNSSDLVAGVTFNPSKKAIQLAKTRLGEIKSPLILINLGGGDPKKIWPPKHFCQLAKYIVEKYNYSIGVFINPGQENLAQEFQKHAEEINFSDFFFLDIENFDEIGAIMQEAKVVISGDTGYMHIAIGSKTPTLGLFTYTRPEPVTPITSAFIPCFIEDPNNKNEFDIPFATRNLPLKFVQSRFDELIQTIQS